MARTLKHKFASAKGDGPDATKVRPSNWNADHDDGATLTNSSGVTLNAGDVVILNTATNNSVTRTTSIGSLKPVFVAAATIVDLAAGRFHFTGPVTINVQNAVSIGDFLRTSATAGRAEGFSGGNLAGAFAVATTAFAGPGSGTVEAVLFANNTTQNSGIQAGTVQVFTASGSFSKSALGILYRVRAVGGGGGGGGADTDGAAGIITAGGGGGGGEYAESLLLASALGASETVTIGALGAGGGVAGGNGAAGGNTSFGALVIANGGGGGTGSGSADSTGNANKAGGAGGTGGTGTILVQGQRGGNGRSVNSQLGMGGAGGSSLLGGGAPSTLGLDFPGFAGQLYGGGGSGAVEDDVTGQGGGDGAPGILIVEEYKFA